MTKLKVFVIVLLVVGIIATFSILPGCKKTTEATATETTKAAETTTTTAAAETTAAEQKVLRIGISKEPDGFDPHLMQALSSYSVVYNIYNGLTRIDEKGQVVADLASSWEISEDGLKYTFTIRSDVKFSDGTPMTVEDVKFSLDRIMNPDTKSTWLTFYDSVKSVDIDGKDKIVITLKEPSSTLLTVLGWKRGAIVSKAAVEKYGDLVKNSVGTGPYMLKEFVSMQKTVLEKNPYYFEKDLPYIDEVELMVIPEGSSRANSLIAGEVDIIDQVPYQMIENLKVTKDISFMETPSSWINYLVLNHTRPPFNNVLVRQAVSYAINRDEILQAGLFGYGSPAYTNIPDGSAFKLKLDIPQYNIEKAKQLMKDAGYDPEEPVDAVNLVLGGFDDMKAAGEVLQSQLKEIGINLIPQVTEPGLWTESMVYSDVKDWDAGITGSVEDTDPYFRYNIYFLTNGTYNMSGYSDPKIDELLPKAATEVDFNKRVEIYTEAIQYLTDEAAWIYLYAIPVTAAIRSDRVMNYELSPENWFQLKNVKFK